MLIPACLALICGAAAVMQVCLASRFNKYVRDYRSSARSGGSGIDPTPSPKVSVILPCKGLDPGFEENLATVFAQDLPDVELVFATATATDPACAVIRRVMARYPAVNARLIHAGLPVACSQQNNNQIEAARAARAQSAIFVVLDSDIRLRRDYLSLLVQPLRDPGVLAATGYRWYSPVKGGLGSWLRSVWNGGALFLMPDSKRNFAWGGSMAFRRADFDPAFLRDLWGTTLSDDHTLSQEIRRRGGRIVFVPPCMAVSYEDTPLSQTIAWTTRQTLVTRVYDMPFWVAILLVHGLQNLAAACGVALLMAGALSLVTWEHGLMGLFLLAPLAGTCLATRHMAAAIESILPPDAADQVRRHRWLYVLLSPVASLLCLWNSLASLCTSKMTWRGVTYQMVSPTKTVVISGQ